MITLPVNISHITSLNVYARTCNTHTHVYTHACIRTRARVYMHEQVYSFRFSVFLVFFFLLSFYSLYFLPPVRSPLFSLCLSFPSILVFLLSASRAHTASHVHAKAGPGYRLLRVPLSGTAAQFPARERERDRSAINRERSALRAARAGARRRVGKRRGSGRR